MRPPLPLRNVLIVVGAYYVAAWVVMPLWWPIMRMTEGRVFPEGSPELGLSEAIHAIPILVTAVLAGAAAGYFLVGSNRALWLTVVGLFLAVCVWSSARWYVRPSTSAMLWQGAKAVISGSLAALAAFAVWNRRAKVEAAERR